MTAEPAPHQKATTSTQPSLSGSGLAAGPASNTVANFIASRFWRIVAGAALVKLVAYFIAPQTLSTLGGHVGAILRGFTVFGITLSVVSLLACQFAREKERMFRIVFAVLFALACFLNLPSACLLRHAFSKANYATTQLAAATQFAAATSAFEALMQYEVNPLIDRYTRVEAYLAHKMEGDTFRKAVDTDAQKYFNLSYCYATGFDGYPRDVQKAIQLCQKAASEPIPHYRGNSTIVKAQELLTKAGLSWRTDQ
jgi:hypothetical protein